MSTGDANNSKLVTNVKNLKKNVIDAPYHIYTDTGKKYISDLILKQIIWVIEVSDARIKMWRCFDCSFTSNQILFIRDCVRIVCT